MEAIQAATYETFDIFSDGNQHIWLTRAAIPFVHHFAFILVPLWWIEIFTFKSWWILLEANLPPNLYIETDISQQPHSLWFVVKIFDITKWSSCTTCPATIHLFKRITKLMEYLSHDVIYDVQCTISSQGPIKCVACSRGLNLKCYLISTPEYYLFPLQ